MSRQYDRLKCRQDAREAGILPVTAEYRVAGGSLSSGSWNKCSPAICAYTNFCEEPKIFRCGYEIRTFLFAQKAYNATFAPNRIFRINYVEE